jgi:hypothetical protein
VLLDRNAEACALLEDAAQKLESPFVVWQLAELYIELGLFNEARASLERCRALAPLMEPDFTARWHARMSDVTYACGDHPHTINHAVTCGKRISSSHRRAPQRANRV